MKTNIIKIISIFVLMTILLSVLLIAPTYLSFRSVMVLLTGFALLAGSIYLLSNKSQIKKRMAIFFLVIGIGAITITGIAAMFAQSVGLLPGDAVVISSDSPGTTRAQAQLVRAFYGNRVQICDGTADNVQINAAIVAVHDAGGGVVQTVGPQLNLAAPITIYYDDITLYTLGCTILYISNGANCPAVWIGRYSGESSSVVRHNVSVKGFEINGNGSNQASGNYSGIYLASNAVDATYGLTFCENIEISNLSIHDCYMDAIYCKIQSVSTSTQVYVHDIFTENNGGRTLYLGGFRDYSVNNIISINNGASLPSGGGNGVIESTSLYRANFSNINMLWTTHTTNGSNGMYLCATSTIDGNYGVQELNLSNITIRGASCNGIVTKAAYVNMVNVNSSYNYDDGFDSEVTTARHGVLNYTNCIARHNGFSVTTAQAGSAEGDGWEVSSTLAAGSAIVNYTNCVAEYNEGVGFLNGSITNGTMVNCVARNNTQHPARGSSFYGFQFTIDSGGSAPCNNMSITNCRAYDDQVSTITDLIANTSSGTTVYVTDGTKFWPFMAITVTDDDTGSESAVIRSISSNTLTLESALTGTFTVAQNAVVTGRQSQAYGFGFSEGASSYMTFIGNNLLDNGTGAVYFVAGCTPTNSIWQDNKGYIDPGEVRTYSGSLVPTGTCTATTVTGTFTESPLALKPGANTMHCTASGTANIVCPAGTTAVVTSVGGGATVTDSPKTCAAGATTLITVTAGGTNDFTITVHHNVFAWHNPELQDIFIQKVVINRTAAGGTATAEINVGIADNGTVDDPGIEFFENLLANNAAALHDSYVAAGTSYGTQTIWVNCQDSASATGGWIVGKLDTEIADLIAGTFYIEYTGK